MTPSFPTRSSSELRPVAGHARRHGGEADLVEVEQAEARLFRREAAAVEEVAGGDAGVEMVGADVGIVEADQFGGRSEEHTSELQSLMRISYAVFCLKKKNSYSITLLHVQYS